MLIILLRLLYHLYLYGSMESEVGKLQRYQIPTSFAASIYTQNYLDLLFSPRTCGPSQFFSEELGLIIHEALRMLGMPFPPNAELDYDDLQLIPPVLRNQYCKIMEDERVCLVTILECDISNESTVKEMYTWCNRDVHEIAIAELVRLFGPHETHWEK